MEDLNGANQVERILTPIMEQLAALQRQVAGMNGERLPTPEGSKEHEVPDVHELALKRPANRDQYRFCRSISTLVEKALSCFDANGDLIKTGGASLAVRNLIQSVGELSSKRQKNIRLADRSDAGWDLVTHYEADPIASDSDDEKRIKSAEKSALAARTKKLLVEKNKRAKSGSYRLFYFQLTLCNKTVDIDSTNQYDSVTALVQAA